MKPDKKETKKKEDKIAVLLEVNDQIQEAGGQTVEEALDKLKKPDVIKTRGLLSIKGKPNSAKQMNINILKRFFVNKTFRQITAKQLSVYVN